MQRPKMRLCDLRLVQGDRRRSCRRSGWTPRTGPDEPEETGRTDAQGAVWVQQPPGPRWGDSR
jgi:hypothetical protein